MQRQTREAREAWAAKLDALFSGEDEHRAFGLLARFWSSSFNNTVLIHIQHQTIFKTGRVPEPSPAYVAELKHWLPLGRIGSGMLLYL